MKKYIGCIIMLGLLIPGVNFAELKDPRTRDVTKGRRNERGRRDLKQTSC